MAAPKKPTDKAPKAKKTPPVKKSPKELKEEPLSDKEEWLCREFVCDYAENQVRAFMHVYPGYSYDSARVASSKVFAKDNMRQRIDELRQERAKRLEITGDRIFAELSKLAFYDPRAFFDSKMKLVPLSELSPDHAAVIAGIETIHKVTGEDGDGQCITTKIKLPDKKGALELLGKHHKLWNDVGSKENPATHVVTVLTPEDANI